MQLYSTHTARVKKLTQNPLKDAVGLFPDIRSLNYSHATNNNRSQRHAPSH